MINKAKFSSHALQILCDEIYGKYTLGHCPSYVLLPSLLLDNHSTNLLQRSCENRYYHNLPYQKCRSDTRRRTVGSSAARREVLPNSVAGHSPTKVMPEISEARPSGACLNDTHPQRMSSNGATSDEAEGDGCLTNEMLSESAADVVMRTIAAPTYFPSHQQHVDGVRKTIVLNVISPLSLILFRYIAGHVCT